MKSEIPNMKQSFDESGERIQKIKKELKDLADRSTAEKAMNQIEQLASLPQIPLGSYRHRSNDGPRVPLQINSSPSGFKGQKGHLNGDESRNSSVTDGSEIIIEPKRNYISLETINKIKSCIGGNRKDCISVGVKLEKSGDVIASSDYLVLSDEEAEVLQSEINQVSYDREYNEAFVYTGEIPPLSHQMMTPDGSQVYGYALLSSEEVEQYSKRDQQKVQKASESMRLGLNTEKYVAMAKEYGASEIALNIIKTAIANERSVVDSEVELLIGDQEDNSFRNVVSEIEGLNEKGIPVFYSGRYSAFSSGFDSYNEYNFPDAPGVDKLVKKFIDDNQPNYGQGVSPDSELLEEKKFDQLSIPQGRSEEIFSLRKKLNIEAYLNIAREQEASALALKIIKFVMTAPDKDKWYDTWVVKELSLSDSEKEEVEQASQEIKRLNKEFEIPVEFSDFDEYFKKKGWELHDGQRLVPDAPGVVRQLEKIISSNKSGGSSSVIAGGKDHENTGKVENTANINPEKLNEIRNMIRQYESEADIVKKLLKKQIRQKINKTYKADPSTIPEEWKSFVQD